MEESYLENEEYVIKTLIEVCNLPKDVVKYVICKYLENKVYRTEDGVYWENSKGKRHRDNDRPAIEWADGTKLWYKNGKLHRDGDKPAAEWADGTKAWYQNGKRHRDNDRPAIEWADGTKLWYKNGKPYRENNLPANGDKPWYKNGNFINSGNKIPKSCIIC